MDKIRVLNFAGKMDFVGVERTLVQYFRNIDKEKVQFDFLVRDAKPGYYDDEIKAAGGKIFVVTSKHNSLLNNIKDTYRVLKENTYDVAHIHCTTSTAFIDAAICKICGCKKVIVHSRTAGFTWPIKGVHLFFRPLLRLFATDYAMCSEEAGRWLVGDRAVSQGKVKLIPNARNCIDFVYNEPVRQQVRKEFDIAQDSIVMGHVGNFMWQKNHVFLAQVFAEFLKIHPTTKLLSVGYNSFPESENAKNKLDASLRDLGIEGNVVFLGKRDDVQRIMQAMDVFIFPSLVEGLPGVVIEAQSAGLPCLVSDMITPECKISSLVKFVSLNDTPKTWADNADKILQTLKRKDMTKEIVASGYDIALAAKSLQRYYQTLLYNK